MIRVDFSEKDLQQISHLRYHHPHPKIQRRMEVLWLRNAGLSREVTAKCAQVHPDTVTDYIKKFSIEGLEGLLKLNYKHPQSELQTHLSTIKQYFTHHLPRTVKEAGLKIKELTQIERKSTQIRKFLAQMGFRYIKSRAIPAKADPEEQKQFKDNTLIPILNEAKQGKREVLFVGAAHFVHSAVLGYI